MKNTYPNKLEMFSILPTYTKVYIYHSPYIDYDIIGKSIWLTKLSDSSVRRIINTDSLTLLNQYVTIDSLASNTSYKVQAAYYDAMIDSQLLEAKTGYLLSSEQSFRTKIAPSITSINVSATPVEVGVSLPLVSLSISGEWNTLQIQYKLASDTTWSDLYEGNASTSPSISMMPGTYNFRCRGVYILPDGLTSDASAWYSWPSAVTIDYQQIPPSAPTNLQYVVAKINDSFEHYDLKLTWSWEKATGSPIREFIVYYTPTSDYNINGWTKAQVINTGASQYCIISPFAYNVEYKFKVVARSWGLEDFAYATSSILTAKITSSTVFDSSFTTLTGLDVNYSGIFGYTGSGASRTQTFRLDSATGGVVIGIPDATTGIAPFSFDPVNEVLNIDGKTITNSIYSANFILSNLTGTPPVLRSQEKLAYGDANQGVWLGYSSNVFKFDLGNSSKYIRWTGSDLLISGNVTIGTPTGNISLDDAVQSKQSVFIYQSAASKPTTPTSTSYPPSGWVTTPPAKEIGKYIWVSSSILNPVTNTLQTGYTWSTPSQFTGTDGETPFISVYGDNANATTAGFSGHRLEINGIIYPKTYTRGHTLYVINPSTKTVISSTTYDTYSLGTGSLVTAINAVATGNIIVLSSYDSTAVDTNLNTALAAFGSNSTVTWAAGRVSHVFIGVRGLSKGQAYESYSSASTSAGVVNVGCYFGNNGIVASGVIGDSAKLLTISSSALVFQANQDNVIQYPASITLTSKLQNMSGSVTWTSSPSITLSTTGTSATVTAEAFGSNNTCTITGSIVYDGVTYSDTITLVRTIAGSDAINVTLSNEAITLPASSSGVVSSFITGVCTATVFRGAINDSANWSVTKVDGYGVTSTLSGKTVNITDMSVDSSTITLTFTRYGFANVVKTITISKSKTGAVGADGTTGSRGAGIFAQSISGFTGTFSTSSAATFFSTNFGSSTPVKYDVLTQYDSTTPSIATTRMWDGSSWVTPSLVVHGNMIVDDTIVASKIVGDSAFFQKAGINTIYNHAAAISTNPEGTYTMKIDLANGFIHIR